MITVRRATPDDLPVVTGFLRRQAEALAYPRPREAVVERAVRLLLTDPLRRSWFLIAERGHEPVGQVRIQATLDDLTGRDIWHLSRLYVRDDCRRAGVATDLLAFARGEAARAGNVAKMTSHVHTWNAPCLQLHDRFPGFSSDSLKYTCPIA